jgi:serine/threonine protein kinase
VAIKVLAKAVADDPERNARFEREARALAALSHPNILAIFDFGTNSGITYAVTELVPGELLICCATSGNSKIWQNREMRDLVILFVHVLATLARLLGPGGLRSVIA